MSQITYAAMRALVHPHVPGCPVPLIDEQLRSMARDFLRRSHVWNVDLDPVDVVANQTDYNIVNTAALTTAKGEVEAIVKVTLDGNVLNAGWDYNIGYDGTVLELVDTPPKAIEDGILMIAACIPASDATGIESWIYNRWGEYIARGVAYKLQATIGKPYFNPDGSAFNRNEYMKGLEIARIRENSGRMTGGIRVTPRPFI